jgi:hypothetical protein
MRLCKYQWYAVRRMMSTTRPSWHNSQPSKDNTYHLLSNGERLYSKTFINGISYTISPFHVVFFYQFYNAVLPFHPPGIAPVLDSSGAYHINDLGEPMYTQRYILFYFNIFIIFSLVSPTIYEGLNELLVSMRALLLLSTLANIIVSFSLLF